MAKQFMMIVAAIMATMSIQAQTDIDLDNEAMYFEILLSAKHRSPHPNSL